MAPWEMRRTCTGEQMKSGPVFVLIRVVAAVTFGVDDDYNDYSYCKYYGFSL